MLCSVCRICWRDAALSSGVEALSVVCIERAKRRPAQPHRLLKQRIEHWREITRRSIDDLQHLRSGGLLLQRLARLGQEPRILHRNDCLRGEVLQ
jgi:hypothetical protein